jgi:glutamate carboxypeptidase
LEGIKANGGSDAAYSTIAGIPSIDSIGIEGERIHSVEEYAIMKSLAESAKRIATVIYGI